MLQAVNQDGVKRHFLEALTEMEWRERKRHERFFCPVCQEEVLIKLGKKKRWHFSHKSRARCPAARHGETDVHRLGKEKLFRWLQSQGEQVSLEYWIPESRQRPDLYICGERQVVIEYQCAEMTVDQTMKRTKAYRAQRMNDMWILSGARVRRRMTQLFRFRLFEWYMSQNRHYERYFVYFDPQSDTFCFLRHVIPLDVSSCFATYTLFPSSEVTLSQLSHPPPMVPSYEASILSYRQKRRKSPVYRYQYRTFLSYLSSYHCHTPPLEAGWPLPSQCYIQIPCDIWQTHFLFSFVATQQNGVILFDQACSFLKRLFATFPHAIVPYCRRRDVIERIVSEYLQLLCVFSSLLPRSASTFVCCSPPHSEWTEETERHHIKYWESLFVNRTSTAMLEGGKSSKKDGYTKERGGGGRSEKG
ncbi:competence protein CoiA family protein [Bacillus sp. FSL W7-1360]